ncbi:MAG: matrixin family metalloprotease [Methylococcaceae bacterium]|nr:matrixin family metalloprotease [Methylococcaceae bacterium]
MHLKKYTSIGVVLLAISQSANALIINFDYTYDTSGFFAGANASRQDILNAAGSFFSNRITDSLSAITSGGNNHFDAQFLRPDTGALATLNDFSVAANTLTVFVGGRDLTGNTLGEGGYGGYSASGTSGFLATIDQRGQSGEATGPSATDFAPWGGQLAFDTNSIWYFDVDPSTTESFSGSDFYSVALHEIGHLLGLGTADSWDNKVSGTNFTGVNAVAAYGGNVPLTTNGSHWQEGTLSTTLTGLSQEAMMDPTITNGTRKLATQLDIAALKDVGWQVSSVPVPASIWLFGSVLATFVGIRRKQSVTV